jgi:hypothetical protein
VSIAKLYEYIHILNEVWEQVVVDGKDMPADKHGYDYV